ncbi:MAG: hypothetical protein EA398_05890 [Deltaproteobacteria bacterium]|nr:MAG: hypothetical protein EA398_05890 [Deltaproteobacteria bacterium]
MRYTGRYRPPRTGMHVLNLVVLCLVLLGILFVGQRAAEFMGDAFVDITELSEEDVADDVEAEVLQSTIRSAHIRVHFGINEARRTAATPDSMER